VFEGFVDCPLCTPKEQLTGEKGAIERTRGERR
jgi:hypothetical protein